MNDELKGHYAPSLPGNLATLRATLRATLIREVPGCAILSKDNDLAVVPIGMAPAWVITYTEVDVCNMLMCQATVRRFDRKKRRVTVRASESLDTFAEMQTWICQTIKTPPTNTSADSWERAADDRAVASVGL